MIALERREMHKQISHMKEVDIPQVSQENEKLKGYLVTGKRIVRGILP